MADYVFGAALIVAAVRLVREGSELNPEWRVLRNWSRTTSEYHDGRFFLRNASGRIILTPLFVVLMVIESTDVVFALDSVPAVVGITSDPYIVFTSNAMAILGMRALFFAIAAVLERLRYLKVALATILGFIGAKMFVHDIVHVPILISISVIFGVLTIAVGLSLRKTRSARSE